MKKNGNSISSEVIAAFLDGNATEQESQEILNELSTGNELQELLEISQCVDEDIFNTPDFEYIPMTAMAASCSDGSYCSMECEKYILRSLGIEYNENELLDNAIREGWQKEEGTALHNIGRHLESHGLIVTRQYNCSIDNIITALNNKENVMVALDEGELSGNKIFEEVEDIYVGEMPDHSVVVLSADKKENTITIHDPNSINNQDTYPIELFMNAWGDSKNYLITATHKNMKPYIPRPIDLSDVELSEDLNELREAIAENAHEVWAENRMAEGWSYGAQRDDSRLLHPDLIPYSQLPESEKEYDRQMAIKTIKLLKKLGYDLVKRR